SGSVRVSGEATEPAKDEVGGRLQLRSSVSSQLPSPGSEEGRSLALLVAALEQRIENLAADLAVEKRRVDAANTSGSTSRLFAADEPMVRAAARVSNSREKPAETWNTAFSLVRDDGEFAELNARIAGLEQQLGLALQGREASEEAARHARIEAEALRAERNRRIAELDALSSSVFWKITIPLRFMVRLGSRLKRFALRGRTSELFDERWYVETYRDVRESGWDPFAHYLRRGAAEGRNPNPLFDTKWYLEQYPDIRVTGINPLLHYVRHGAAEGRDPNFLFDTDWYVENNSGVRESGMNPLLHYIRIGSRDGRDPSPFFSGAYYLDKLK
ncbi:MAG: hypothetical protein WCK17_14130, partial [Verrucomicrobiota bacterium]